MANTVIQRRPSALRASWSTSRQPAASRPSGMSMPVTVDSGRASSVAATVTVTAGKPGAGKSAARQWSATCSPAPCPLTPCPLTPCSLTPCPLTPCSLTPGPAGARVTATQPPAQPSTPVTVSPASSRAPSPRAASQPSGGGTVLRDMNSLFSKMLIGIALGAGPAGCTAAHGAFAGPSSVATSRVAPASRVAGAASSAPAGVTSSSIAQSRVAQSRVASPTSAATTAAPVATGSPAPATAAVTGVGVVADCAGAAPFLLSKEPSSIILACADSGIGIQDLEWTSWSASTAAGTGLLWEDLCTPSCADGTYGHYPDAVTLSAGKDSVRGEWFGRLSLSWEGSHPDNHTPDSYTLTQPSS